MSRIDPVSGASFAARWNALGGDRAEEVHAALLRRYRARGRHYHDLEHVAACLHWAMSADDVVEDADAVAIALWFHDAVHEPGPGDDVAASAALFAEMATERGVPAPTVARVRALIEATRHDGAELHGDAAVVADADLAILGSDPARFARYEDAVRREYAHVDDVTYRRGRAAILRGFLERLAIYHTPRFAERLEAQARENLGASLRRLEASEA